ncbi:hypothetical protein LSCM1_02676 [Leishmania martiniquensis]|uniref:Mitochondrial RNA binding complex 1 subunit n=1 Tax=Leishmania martiniquensis TaxID=1580590 RepID=A0A836GPL9_9TRYP|nr:hypothetical protein LSCM1_02676 [Leishmania martiniquensis]
MGAPRLTALISRCRKPIFTASEDVVQAAAALLDLTLYLNGRETRECIAPLKKFARHDPEILQAALDSTDVSPQAVDSGRRYAIVSRVIPTSKSAVAAALWSRVVNVTTRALQDNVWTPSDLRVIISHIHRFSAYDAAFVECAARYAGAAIPCASADDLPALVSIVTSLPELAAHPMRLLDVAGERAASLAESLTPGAVGHICSQLNRNLSTNTNAVIAFQEEIGRCAEKGDTFTAVQLLCFVARHKPAVISSEAVLWLLERITGEELDVRSIENLSSAVVHLPFAVRTALRQELMEFVVFLSLQARELLQQVPAAQGGLCGCDDADAIRHFVSHVLELSVMLRAYPNLQWPPEYLAAADACAASVGPLQEALLSSESSPVGLMVRLLEAPTDECKRVGLAMLREAANQCQSFPALQTFRFLLLMGDHGLRDAGTSRYLRDQFSKTAADVPPVQLSVALRCLSVATAGGSPRGAATQGARSASEPCATLECAAGDADVDDEIERDRLDGFLQFCVEVSRKHLSQGAPMRCVLATTEGLHRLGCRDTAFYADVAAYIAAKRTAACVEKESAETASAVYAALGEDMLREHPATREFLLDVAQRGVKGESAMPPTQWLNLHDPANTLTPLTEQQQEGWDIVEEMVRTRSDDVDALVRLAEKYVKLLPFARPDDHKYFFGVCEEKVLKQDKLLKKCLDAMVDCGVLSRLSAQTIASILHSLAAIRFEYFASVKRFMSSISDEQWLSMDAAPLVQILTGMDKLSLRTPAVLHRIGGRLAEICRFLTPLDTAQAIHALQALGHNDAVLLAKLTAHAAALARRFDEASMAVLFSTPSIHRLMNTPEVARPLLLQASAKIQSPHRREKISAWVRRSGLPRELIDESTRRLQVTSEDARPQEARLRLT